MRTTDAKVIICSPGRNFVTLKLITEDGLYGWGDATLSGRNSLWPAI
jgi:mannonate dehydratase